MTHATAAARRSTTTATIGQRRLIRRGTTGMLSAALADDKFGYMFIAVPSAAMPLYYSSNALIASATP